MRLSFISPPSAGGLKKKSKKKDVDKTYDMNGRKMGCVLLSSVIINRSIIIISPT